jgi:hypothetical protein
MAEDIKTVIEEFPKEPSREEKLREKSDIKDSPEDEAKLQAEETIIELPDVEDIPGQENITVPPLGEMSDTTIASDDEDPDL